MTVLPVTLVHHQQQAHRQLLNIQLLEVVLSQAQQQNLLQKPRQRPLKLPKPRQQKQPNHCQKFQVKTAQPYTKFEYQNENEIT